MSLLVAVETDMTDLCGRNEGKDTVYHSKTCAQDRNDRKFLTGKHRSHTGLDRSLDLNVLQREIAECLISHQSCDLLNKSTELICSCGLLS